MNNIELVTFATSKLGTPYVYGTKGKVLTSSLLNNLSNNYPNIFTNTYKSKAKTFIGKVCTDCSGLISWGTGILRGSANYFDTAKEKGNIENIPEIVGLGVYKKGHIGIYIGNGQVIEAKGINYGVVKSNLQDTKWTHYLFLRDIDYSPTTSIPVSTSNTSSTIKCVDVSSYQGNINWSLVKSSGINQAILKIIRKDLNPDNKFEQNWRGCQDAGIDIRGVYNYSYSTTVNKAKEDAQKVLSVLNGRKCTIWLDLEDKCQQGLGSILKDIINAYRDVIVSAGYEFGIYTGPSFYNPYIKPYISQIKCDRWWLARYYNGNNKMSVSIDPNEQFNPKIMTGINSIYAWQYTSSGQVPGINGNVDLNVIYEDLKSSVTSKPISEISETLTTLLGKINTNSSNLNIRFAPNSSSAIVGSYKKNELVQLISRTSNNWYRTEKGYISGEYVIIAKGKVNNCSKLNMRKEPEVKVNNVVGVLKVNEEVYLMKCTDNGWYKVKTKNNLVGYVSGKYITIL